MFSKKKVKLMTQYMKWVADRAEKGEISASEADEIIADCLLTNLSEFAKRQSDKYDEELDQMVENGKYSQEQWDNALNHHVKYYSLYKAIGEI